MTTKLQFIFVLVWTAKMVSSTRAGICPYMDASCKCEGTSLTCKHLQTIPRLQTGNDVVPVDTLLFDEGEITSIPENSLPPNLVDISFKLNPLTDISDEAFRESTSTLKQLLIEKADFKQLPSALTNLTNLINFTLSVIDIDDWNSDALHNIAKSINRLSLMSIDLSVWPDWISQCKALSQLIILYGNITSIPENTFSLMNSTLVYFTAIYSGLREVPSAVSSLRNLTTIDLSENLLHDVNGRPGLEQLMTYSLAETLEKLTSMNSFMKTIPDLSNGSSLLHLELFMNDIEEVISDKLPPSLVYLSLQTNKISRITDRSFTNLLKLEILYIGDNPITTISSLAFNDLKSLRVLGLFKTELTRIPIALKLLSGLTSLDMSDISSLQCPCPSPPDLTSWYASYNASLTCKGLCCNQESITSYLRGTCQPKPTTTETCPSDSTTAHVNNIGCNYCLQLLLIMYLHSL